MPHDLEYASPAVLHPFWAADIDDRLRGFALMRERSAGVEYHLDAGGNGLWSVTSHAAVSRVSRDPATFTSTAGFSMDDFPPEVLEVMASIIAMDDPRHGRQRKLVQSAFSPRAIKRLTESVGTLADAIVDEIRERREFDFVTAVGANLPLQVICDLLDIPAADRAEVRELINKILGVNDPDFGGPEVALQSLLSLYGYAIELGRQRLASPGDDITSVLMHAEIDGCRLSPAEFGSFVVLLVSAGNDTTRTALTWGMKLLSDHPAQMRSLREDFGGRHSNAIEEILRWCSPALHMRRTATEDIDLGDQRIAKGDKVVLWYLAANHDPAVFADPDAFDIARANARDHIAFGAGGPHFCLGSNLARMELTVVLDKLLQAFPDLHATGAPEVLMSPFVHTIKSLPCSIG
ncbi:cytochrome P450 [Mycolicibacterium arenosum]|uniref:Cytochrome P450 n=1 Tax=Mycolicibacterium arenosum TaxID=2952157 RepID=A0ABT1M7S0_9MYCO|nr:cytochrome P450 [Mycolicibacterium sp. CAU 1645]MCP9275221.1 cytochrome P450 [Mycolicibacterium sp. CAU 1645]